MKHYSEAVCTSTMHGRRYRPRITDPLLAVVAILAIACGCATNRQSYLSRYPAVSFAQVCELKRDGVVRTDVEALLGAPNSVMITSEGEQATYMFRPIPDHTAPVGRPADNDNSAFGPRSELMAALFTYDSRGVPTCINFRGGGRLNPAYAQRFRKGQTSAREVYAAYGYPDMLTRKPDGTVNASYFYMPLPAPAVTNTSGRTIGNRVYLRRQDLANQMMLIQFDRNGLIDELSVPPEKSTIYFFTNPGKNYCGPFIDEQTIRTLKLNPMKLSQIDRLLGEPYTIRRSGSEVTYMYMRGTLGKQSQTLTVEYGTNFVSKSVSSIGSQVNSRSEMAAVTGMKILSITVNTITCLTKAYVGPSGPALSKNNHFMQSGQQLDNESVQSLRPGQTTREEVLQIIGLPDRVQWMDNGTTRYVYSWMSVKSLAKFFSAQQDISSQWESHIVTFDENDILADVVEKYGSSRSSP